MIIEQRKIVKWKCKNCKSRLGISIPFDSPICRLVEISDGVSELIHIKNGHICPICHSIQ